MFVCHRCDNRPCCEPAHLFLGTHADNMTDMRSKLRHAMGERHGNAKLTAAQVRQIRASLAAGSLQKTLAATYGVSKQTISKIAHNKKWKETSMNATLGQLIERHGVDVLDHLDRETDIPVLDSLQFQGDLAVIPEPDANVTGTPVPAAGIAVIEAVGSGHEHRLLPGRPGTARFVSLAGDQGQDIGHLLTTEPAYLAHPEHGYLGIAPGAYVLRRQREQADEERLVAD
jgi:DNA-binding XRE family transcriptional regulator